MCANAYLFKASETELIIPAPSRHKKKVRRYGNNRKNTKETGIYQPSIQHKIGGKDSSDRSRFLCVGYGLYLGGFGRGFLLEYPKGYRILPILSYRSDRLFLVFIHSHFLIPTVMSKVFLLGANKEIDRAKQVVKVNQIIQMEGYSYDRYVVYEIRTNDWGIAYKLINLRTKEFYTADIIRPLNEKFGIGYYYDSENPQFMDAFEVAILLQQAHGQKKAEDEKAEQEKIRVEQVKEIGRKRFAEILPEDAQAVIVARLRQNESDSQTDYYGYSTQRTVIIGFSKHKRDIFSEMRKHASNFEETAYLAEPNEDYEHREKYSMGDGYYLGESKYSGWIIEKEPVYDRNRTIENFAYIAGSEDNIHLKKTDTTPPNSENGTGKNACTLVEYSAKAVAVFGDTKAIKDELKAMGGRFNSHLTFNGKRLAGWIFSKSQERQLAYYFGLD
ncbi:hypothetical protein HMPREF9455_04138 [Dysgonomonas gadei ATCC BAA-286]|uniref:Fusion protein n=2 Tax=Bacteroidales TaxID=171549 RepID=F5J471_9BACT|nr:hypothetical protein HMPREF9455_04138 [Dysgonomonas gadei ATCC BAA-286]